MAEYPPLGKSYVSGYANNDRDYPIVAIRKDPRVENYRIPENLSPHPDSSRWPNHVFTGAQPTRSDERVEWVYEILPGPWVPFTRYDDDLGPIQGRRRAVKNEGQVASLGPTSRTVYEARDGSANIFIESEENWSNGSGSELNPEFPIRNRDFYDASRGAVQESRQIIVTTGNEVGSIENIGGTITQISYEPYNEFLSVKIVQTYNVNGPRLVGNTTNNEGQLLTVITQRKGVDGYVPPSPTAKRTVEVSTEDAESLVERIVDAPEVFSAKTFSKERPDPIPEKFRVLIPTETEQETIEGQASLPTLNSGELSKSEQQQTKFVKRVSTTTRDQTSLPRTLTQKATSEDRQIATITETLQAGDTIEQPTATKTIESEAIGDGNYVVRKTEVPQIFSAKTFSKERPDPIPQKFRVATPSVTEQETIGGTASEPSLSEGDLSKSEQQVNQFVKRIATTARAVTSLPVTLTQKITTNDGILATVTETLQSEDTTDSPTATKSIQSEALGDGTYVVTTTNLPKVFEGKTISSEKPDNIPTEFRAQVPSKTEEINVIGTMSESGVTLSGNEISKSEQQVTEFVKRIRTTTRDLGSIPTLTGQQIDENGVSVDVVRTLASGSQRITPSALVSGSVESIGDNKTVKTELTKQKVFDNKIISNQQVTQLPSKFVTSQSEESSVVEGADATPDVLGAGGTGITQSSAQRTSEFTVRKSKTTVDARTSIVENQINNEKQKVIVTSSIVDDPNISPTAKTEFVRTQAIGGDKYIREEGVVDSIFDSRTLSASKPDVIPEQFRASVPSVTTQEVVEQTSVEVPSLGAGELEKSEQRLTEFTVRKTEVKRDISTFPTLRGQDYESGVNITIPFEEKITPSGLALGSDATFVDPLSEDFDLVRKIDLDSVRSELNSVFLSFPTRTSLNLPKILRSVEILWDTSFDDANFSSDWLGYATGTSGSLSGSESGRASAQASVSPSFIVDLEEVYATNIPTTSYFFFLPYPVSLEDILQRVGAQPWPIFKPQSHVLSAFGQSGRVSVEGSASASSTFSKTTDSQDRTTGAGSSYARAQQTVTVSIPSSIHGTITIEGSAGIPEVEGTADFSIGWVGTDFPSVSVVRSAAIKVKGKAPTTIPSVIGPTDIPRSGKYLIDSRVELYQYGYAKIYAEVLDATIFA